jgi:hypothetical protein
MGTVRFPSVKYKILLWCLLVDLALSEFGMSARDLWNGLWVAASRFYEWGVSPFGWASDYISIGAAVVIPIVVFSYLWRQIRSQ